MGMYVDKQKLVESLRAYRAECLTKESFADFPTMPNDIGKAIIDICENLASRHNFNGYSFRDDMVGEAI
jgi:hypothetical protein